MKSKTVAAGMEGSARKVVESGGTQSQPSIAPSIEEIELRAYEIHVDRGCVHGFDQEDWLQAERELLEKLHSR